MKAGKALGPSGIVVMILANGGTGASMICDLAAAIIHNGKVPSDRVSLSASTRVREMHWKVATTVVSS